MIWRLTDISIRIRLTLMLFLGLGMTAAVLGLASYLIHQYRVNGPRHIPIKINRELRAEIAPPTLYLSELYLVLQELETSTRPEEIQRHLAALELAITTYETERAEAIAKVTEGNLRRKIETDVDRTAQEVIQVARKDYLPLIGKGKQAEISAVLRDKLAPAFRVHRKVVQDTNALILEQTKELERNLLIESDYYLNWLQIICVVGVVLGGILGWVTVRGIVRGTQLLLDRVNKLASGASDLTARIPVETHDEMGKLAEGINAIIARIQSIVSKVRESSIQLLSTASEIAATARQQDATVQGLTSSTAQVASAVREISATSKELSGTMSDVNDRANQAAALAAAGRTRLGSMETTMGQLVESTASISTKLATIREKADNINVVVTTITKVADQTNLLSINAAIEAEKAGEYGRGFLVVAREIRRLADQTAVATLDIENMVRHMQDAVSTGVMQMDKFSDEVRAGVGRVAEINGQTGQIIEEVHGLSQRYHQVNESMRNQAIGAEQINEAMSSMTGNIRATAAALEEFNRATTHLRDSVEVLNQEISQFKITSGERPAIAG